MDLNLNNLQNNKLTHLNQELDLDDLQSHYSV